MMVTRTAACQSWTSESPLLLPDRGEDAFATRPGRDCGIGKRSCSQCAVRAANASGESFFPTYGGLSPRIKGLVATLAGVSSSQCYSESPRCSSTWSVDSRPGFAWKWRAAIRRLGENYTRSRKIRAPVRYLLTGRRIVGDGTSRPHNRGPAPAEDNPFVACTRRRGGVQYSNPTNVGVLSKLKTAHAALPTIEPNGDDARLLDLDPGR